MVLKPRAVRMYSIGAVTVAFVTGDLELLNPVAGVQKISVGLPVTFPLMVIISPALQTLRSGPALTVKLHWLNACIDRNPIINRLSKIRLNIKPKKTKFNANFGNSGVLINLFCNQLNQRKFYR